MGRMLGPAGRVAVLVAMSCLLAAPGVAAPQAAPGALDPTFNVDGKATTSFSGATEALAEDVLVYHGRTLAVGYALTNDRSQFALSRYRWNGRPDGSFGGDGSVMTEWSPDPARAHRAVRYGKWKVLAAGVARPEVGDESQLALARYRWDGELDETFDADGQALVSIVGGSDYLQFSYVTDVRVQPNGRIRIAAITQGWDGSQYHQQIVVARFEGDGSLDGTFGDGGLIVGEPIVYSNGPYGDRETLFEAATLLPGGGFIGAGFVPMGGCCRFPLVVARYNADGTLDQSFGGDGHVRTASPELDTPKISDIVIDADKNVLLGGWLYGDCSSCPTRLHRFTPAGKVDKGFGDNGVVSTTRDGWDSHLGSLVLQPNGRILAAGSVHRPVAGGYESVLQTARYTEAGVLDRTFGGDGIVRTGFAPPTASVGRSLGRGIALHPQGRIVTAGGLWPNEGDTFSAEFAVARYLR